MRVNWKSFARTSAMSFAKTSIIALAGTAVLVFGVTAWYNSQRTCTTAEAAFNQRASQLANSRVDESKNERLPVVRMIACVADADRIRLSEVISLIHRYRPWLRPVGYLYGIVILTVGFAFAQLLLAPFLITKALMEIIRVHRSKEAHTYA